MKGAKRCSVFLNIFRIDRMQLGFQKKCSSLSVCKKVFGPEILLNISAV